MLEFLPTIKFDDPGMFWWLLLIIVLLVIIIKDFVNLKLMPQEETRRRKTRFWIFISRSLILLLLVMSLASPYIPKVTETQGNPRISLLVDKSNSMNFLDSSFLDSLKTSLDKKIPVSVKEFGSAETSNLGESILENLEQGGSMIVFSDGNVNKGASLDDVALYASNLNASISVLNSSSLKDEFAIVINGPSKIVADTEENYFVKVTGTTNDKKVKIRVTVDNTVVLNEETYPGVVEFSKALGEGDHEFTAEILSPDSYINNNKFFKVVHSLKKPKILLIANKKNSPVEQFLKQLYSVDYKSFIDKNTDLKPYYSVVLDDVGEEKVSDGVQNLNNYLLDEEGNYYGNGLVVLGGLNSFDKGGYSSSPIRTLLPVNVGKGKKKTGNDNLVFILGLTGGTGGTKFVKQENGSYLEVKEAVPTEAIIRSQAINAIEQLRIDNKVGVVAFGITSIGHSENVDVAREKTVAVLENVDYLYNNRENIINDIKDIRGGGSYNLGIAFRKAIDMLKDKTGNKHIILLTDGRFCAGFGFDCKEAKMVLNQVSNLKKMGINVMTVGVGPENDENFGKKVDEIFLKELAKTGDGTYDRATKLQTLLIKWGDPEAKKYGEEFSLVPLSLTHFITRDLEFNSSFNGFNQVYPKDSSELLITNDGGQPALTVWRYGNGRVASWNVFRGNGLGGLLNQDSEVMSRTLNWAIGDPERKEKHSVSIQDSRVNEEIKVVVKSDTPVSVEGLDFIKSGDYYEASFSSKNKKVGFGELLGTKYAINNPSEYDEVGFNNQLLSLSQLTGGKVFSPKDIDAMVEHAEEVSKKVTLDKKYIKYPLLIIAIIIFLFEIYIRKLTERRKK